MSEERMVVLVAVWCAGHFLAVLMAFTRYLSAWCPGEVRASARSLLLAVFLGPLMLAWAVSRFVFDVLLDAELWEAKR